MTQPLPDMTPEEISSAFSQAAGQALPQTNAPVAPAPAAQQDSEPVQHEVVSAAFRAAQAAGFDTSNFSSDEELVQAMYSQLNQLKPYAAYAQEVLPYDRDLRELINKKSAPAPQKEQEQPPEEWKPETHFRKAWGTPEYDKGWEAFIQSGMVTIDPDTGQFVASPKYGQVVPINVLQGLNSHRQWQRQALERLVQNPFEETWKAFQEPLDRYIQDKISSHFRQRDSLQAVNAWERANEKRLYEHDAQGNMVYDVYGNPKTTQYGDTFIAAARDARQRFAGASQEDVIRYAEAIAAAMVPQQVAPPVEQSQQAQPVLDQTEAEEPFLTKARRKAAHAPNAGGYSEATDLEPVALGARELDNLFVVESKKLSGKR